LARHRKLYGIADSRTIGHFQKKASDALLSGLDQKQDVILHPPKFATGYHPKLLGNAVVSSSQCDLSFPKIISGRIDDVARL
jgi:hypothetical protein